MNPCVELAQLNHPHGNWLFPLTHDADAGAIAVHQRFLHFSNYLHARTHVRETCEGEERRHSISDEAVGVKAPAE